MNNNPFSSSVISAEWPQMAKAAFYGLAGRIVGAIAPYTEADPVALLVHILAEFATIIGRGASRERVRHEY